jgi:hypothetical protein
MLKKIIIVISLLLSTTAVFAADVENIVGKDGSISTQVLVKKLPVQISELNDRIKEPSQTSQLEPTLADAWLISLALLGFIMLSNRSGV